MKSLLLFVFLAIIATGYGLKCYSCKDEEGEEEKCTKDELEGNKDKYSISCPSGTDRCMRIWGKDKDGKKHIANSCSNEAGCKLTKEACEDPEEGECVSDCCEDDNCNASSTVSFSVILMAACSVFGLALMK